MVPQDPYFDGSWIRAAGTPLFFLEAAPLQFLMWCSSSLCLLYPYNGKKCNVINLPGTSCSLSTLVDLETTVALMLEYSV